MATLALLVSLLLSWRCFKSKRELVRRGRSETLSAKAYGRLLEPSLSLAIVLLFYHLLLAVVSFGWRWMTVGDLRRLELWLVSAQQTLNEYKPSWGMWLGVLIVLYLASRMWIRFLGEDTPFRVLKRMKRVVQIVSTVVFLLAFFTLLGFDPGKPANTLEINLRRTRTEYGVLRRDLRTALIDTAISRAYRQAENEVPGAHEISSLLDRSLERESMLVSTYAEARAKHVPRDRNIEFLLKRYEEREARLRNSHATEEERDISVESEDSTPPENASYAEVSKARSKLEEFNNRVHPEVLRLLNKPGGKDIVLELPAGAINHLAELLSHASDAFPPAKLLIDAAKSISTDAMKLILKRKLDDLTKAALEHPERIEASLPAAAEEIADSPSLRNTPESGRESQREVAALKKELGQLEAADEHLHREIAIAESPHVPRPTTTATASRYQTNVPREEPRSEPEPRTGLRPYSEPSIDPHPLPAIEPYSPPAGEPSAGPFLPSSGGQCTCNTYIDGALVSSVPIPPGAVCGAQVCR